MSREECGRLFTLLAQFYPREQKLRSALWREAWVQALVPYRYEPVKARVLVYAAQKRFFPDLSDLTANLPRRAEIALLPYAGFCRILHNHNGLVGELLHRYIPQECTDCTRRATCRDYARVMAGQASSEKEARE